MSAHPNIILMACLTPDDLPMKTMRAILADEGITDAIDEAAITLGAEHFGEDFRCFVMNGAYNDGMQITGKSGDLIFHTFLTYGYGEVVSIETLNTRIRTLEEWAKKTAEKHHCTYRIELTANYW